MSKATLTIDLPSSCWYCPLHNDTRNRTKCRGAEGRTTEYEDRETIRPNWCPLQIIPDLSDVNVMPVNEQDQKAQANAEMATQILRYYNDHPDELAALLKEIEQ